MKKIICLFLLLSTMVSSISMTVYANEEIRVCVDGDYVTFDVPPQAINGRTMVPIRAIFEAMGASVLWNQSTQAAICVKDDTIIRVAVGDYAISVDGVTTQMDVAPVVIDGRILIPARYVAESLGYIVMWDEGNKIVNIDSINDTYSNGVDIPEYLTDFFVSYEESRKEYVVYFGFLDTDGFYVRYYGNAEINIVNDEGENLYSNTIEVNSSMFDTYTRAYTGDKTYLLCKIEIPLSDVKKGLSRMGKCTLDFYNDETSFGTVYDNLFDLPELTGAELADIKYRTSFKISRDKPSGASWWDLNVSSFKITNIDMAFNGKLKIDYEMQGIVSGNDYFSFDVKCYDDTGAVLGKETIFHDVGDGQVFRVNGFQFLPFGTTRIEFESKGW